LLTVKKYLINVAFVLHADTVAVQQGSRLFMVAGFEVMPNGFVE